MKKKLIYQIQMQLNGRMTQLPDSQKLFGALVYLYAEHCSHDKASEWVAKVKNKETFISLSSMLPLHYLPVPHTYLVDRLVSPDGKKRYKELKKRHYVPATRLNELLEMPDKAAALYPYISMESSQKIHAAIDSLQYDMPGLPPNLYSVPEVTAVEINKGNKNSAETKQVVKQFSFYLAMDEGEESLEMKSALDRAKDEGRLFFLGARASQGLNTFTLEEIKEQRGIYDHSANAYLNLGMLLPQRIDYAQSALKLFTSERRPYNPPGGWEQSNAGHFISFIEPGSIIVPESEGELQDTSRSVTSPFNDDEIVFGHGFMLPIGMKEGSNNV